MKSNSTARKSSAQKKSSSPAASRGQSSRKPSPSNGRSAAASRNGSSNGASRKSGARTPQESLRKMFEDLMKDTYWAEKHITKALPKMSKAADSQELKDAFDNHLRETEEQIARLEQVFELCELKVAAKKCEAMEGLVQEGKEIIDEHEAGPVRDAALIIAAQKVEHYEIAAYGSMRTLATVMGQEDAAQLLQETLEEEANTDELLTQIAMRINQEAYGESGEESEDEDYDEDEEADDVEASDDEENIEEEEETEEGVSGNRR